MGRRPDADREPLGFVAADGVTATYSRTAGETVAGGPYTITATLSPAGVLDNYAITQRGRGLHDQREGGAGTPAAASKTYGEADPTPLTRGAASWRRTA